MASATGRTTAPVPAKSSAHPPTRQRSRSTSQSSTPGCSATYRSASALLPTPGGPLRWSRRATLATLGPAAGEGQDQHDRRVVVDPDLGAGRDGPVLMHEPAPVGDVAAADVETLRGAVVGVQPDAESDGGAALRGGTLEGVREAAADAAVAARRQHVQVADLGRARAPERRVGRLPQQRAVAREAP